MSVRLLLFAGVATLGLAACTTTDEIIIDRKGVNMARYEADKAECEAYAEEVRTGEKAARGAASGAVVGGAVGAIVGDSSKSAARGAGVGAVTGGARGIAEGERDKVQVVKRCLRGRGYKVLN
jgi:outer membrane lipoprotein SlyB